MMDYKHCPKCNGEMVILPTQTGSTAWELTCSACGHEISRYDIQYPWRISFNAASNSINEIELLKKRTGDWSTQIAEWEQHRDVNLASLFNPALPEELEALRESIRQQYR